MIPKNDDIRMEVSTVCNYSCWCCPHSKMRRRKEIMETGDFEYYLDKILMDTDQYKHITFSGMGEPLLDLDIVKKVRYARKRKLKVTIVTNGSLLTPEIYKEFCKAGVQTVRVSMVGMLDYGKSHGCPDSNLADMMDSFRKIIDMGGKTLLAVNCVAENINEYNIMLRVLGDQIEQLEIWQAHNWGNGFRLRNRTYTRVSNCGRLFTGPLQVQVDGKVVACCFDYAGRTELGHLKHSTLDEIFTGAEYVTQVCHSNTGDWKGAGYPCYQCDQRNGDKDGILMYSSRLVDSENRVKMTSNTLSKVSPQQAEHKMCLKCGKMFQPRSRFNKVCAPCRNENKGFGQFAGGISVHKSKGE